MDRPDVTDREWRATHCVECFQCPEQCAKCGCHEPPEEVPDAVVQGR